MKYFKFLKTIDEATLMALAKREFYDQEIHPHEDLNIVNAIFFRDVSIQNRISQNACIFKTKQEAANYTN